jgi:hypothetical protein
MASDTCAGSPAAIASMILWRQRKLRLNSVH